MRPRPSTMTEPEQNPIQKSRHHHMLSDTTGGVTAEHLNLVPPQLTLSNRRVLFPPPPRTLRTRIPSACLKPLLFSLSRL